MASNKSRKLIGKNFRLIDFNVYDESKKDSTGNSDNESISSNDSRDKKLPYAEQQFYIQMFGINETGETASITITDYNPFFYLKVGDNWKENDALELLQFLRQKESLRKFSQAILSIKLIDRKKLYGFTGGKTHKFVFLEFKNTKAMNSVKNLFFTYDSETNNRKFKPFVFNKTTLELYESNIPPLLRYFHIQEISPSGWVFIQTNKVTTVQNKNTTCKYEYTSLKKYVKPNTSKETRVPYKICSFDIEASSSHGDFPVPIKSYKKLATNIVDIFNAQDNMDNKRIVLLLEKIIMTAFNYGKFEDVDSVYPINKISKEKVKSAIKKLLNKSIGSIVLEKNNTILGIEQMFENSKQEETQEHNVGDIEEPDNENTWKKSKTKKEKVDEKTTIIDILNSNEFERDRKIDEINKLFMDMSSGFPKLEGDRVTFIGSTFMKYGETKPYLNHCLVLGDCDEISNIEIDTCTTEQELLLKWTQIMEKENPDIIIGYNIFGFDYEFLFRRAQENMCTNEFMKFSRICNEFSAKLVFNKETQQNTEDLENTKVVLASGEYDLRYFKMTGRLQIDMYSYFRRDFNLSSYKLDDVAGEFISDTIKNIEYLIEEDHTHLYSSNLAGLNIGDYIHIEITKFSSDYYNGGEKFKVFDIMKNVEKNGKKFNVIVIKGQHDLDMNFKLKWTMAKDDVSPQDIFRLSNGNSSDRAVVAKYCIQDCNLVHHLMNKIDVLTGYVEMSSICSVPISFLVFRGQGIKLTSYVAKKCREKNTLMPELQRSNNGGGYEGAIVLPPKCSMYMDNPVACVDYSSLYPSSMISQNYSHDSKVWTKEYDLQGNLIKETGEKNPKTGEYLYENLPGYEYIHIEFDDYRYLRPQNNPKAREVKTKVGKIICCWAQLPDGQKSIMPSILEELLSARKATRKKIKSEPDPFMQNILDKRQLGYKVTANSLYGQCGAKTSTFYEKDVAASTTATGRSMIIYAKKIIEEVYGDRMYETKEDGVVLTKAEYVYGDTDSVFFTFNLEDPKTKKPIRGQKALALTIEIAQDAAHLCSQYLKPPMDLEYEKTLMPFILLSKKRYVGMLYEDDPNKGSLKYMGLVLKRRDNCDLVKDVYGGVLDILMKDTNIDNSIKFLNNYLEDLIQGKIHMDKLAITKALRGYYKNPKQIAHNVLANRMGKRDPGNKPKPGDRIKYLYINTKDKKALQGDKIENPEYIIQNKLQIDYNHYITNQLMKPLQQLFGLALEQIWKKQNKTKNIREYTKEMKVLEENYGDDIETFMKKKEKYCSEKIKKMLFDQFLTKIYNKQHGIQTMDMFLK
jgi:DNA polymerase elongation subunit (family B)